MTNAWIEIGTLDDVPVMGARVVRRGSLSVAIFRTADDRVFALEDRCPHKNGPLSQGIVHGTRVTCPLHNQIINLADGAVCAPDTGTVASFPVRVEGRRIEVQLGQG
jgi:nitrite reductase (NADH) small subunit